MVRIDSRRGYLKSESSVEQRAVARWRPGIRWYHPLMAWVVIGTSRFVMKRLNRLEIRGLERFESAQAEAVTSGRGLLTFSNHVSLFDDPLLVSNFISGAYRSARWVGADAVNFFGSGPKAWLFTAGKSVPIMRGAGLEQPGVQFLIGRLRDGEWVHIFPEGGRTRDREARLAPSFKAGIGKMIAEAWPVTLPFYHSGMEKVLPIGAVRPRWGNVVRVLFGEAMDWSDASRRPALEGLALWEALAADAHAQMRRLEEQMLSTAKGAVA